MDFLDALFGSETDSDRLAERNLRHEEEWLSRLVELRKSRGMSQSEIGELMGISQSGVARIESGNRDLHMSSLRRYALAVGAEVRHIVNPALPSVTVDISATEPAVVQRVQRAEHPAFSLTLSMGA